MVIYRSITQPTVRYWRSWYDGCEVCQTVKLSDRRSVTIYSTYTMTLILSVTLYTLITGLHQLGWFNCNNNMCRKQDKDQWQCQSTSLGNAALNPSLYGTVTVSPWLGFYLARQMVQHTDRHTDKARSMTCHEQRNSLKPGRRKEWIIIHWIIHDLA